MLNEKFLFGAAASAHQVEGGNLNDWTEWEKETAHRKAQRARGESWPAHILAKWPSPLDEENYHSGRAADHYRRFEEDFDIAKSLGHTAHRFSVEWSRVEPEEGKWDPEALAHYRAVVRALRKRKIEPFVSLWHWTVPLWFRDRGGWASSRAPRYFARYARKVAEELGEGVKFWLTVNEPEIYSSHTCLIGHWPPSRRAPLSYLAVLDNLARGHRAAYAALKEVNRGAQVGIAKNNIYFEAADGWWNRVMKTFADWWWNRYFLDRIAKRQDFIGVNYYFHSRIAGWFNRNENRRVSDAGWELYPEGIYHVLRDLARYRKPLYITENGLADMRDHDRAEFIRETLRAVRRAIGEGVDVRGYLHWALTDNFEWEKGFWPRFGLVEVDYRTLERRIRPSALAYRDLIKEWPTI